MMKYLVFSGERYYPNGGSGDLSAVFDTLEEAKAHADRLVLEPDWIAPDWQEILIITDMDFHCIIRTAVKGAFEGRMVIREMSDWTEEKQKV